VLQVGHSPAGRATTLTLYGAAMNLGISLGAVLGGIALARAGYVALGLYTMALPLVTSIVQIGLIGVSFHRITEYRQEPVLLRLIDFCN
jgi:predicted MFS family arabinose efflux permease